MITRILRPFIPQIILKRIHAFRHKNKRRQQYKKELKNWGKNGRPSPPPHYLKQLIVSKYQKKYNYSTLIETGTYMGDMVEAQKNNFNKIISIELGDDLYNNAKIRFKDNKKITIVRGDSGKILPSILSDINDPAIFWLDGHYSAGVTAKGEKECPIFEELDAIFQSKKLNHILLIDDARCFNGEGDYPRIEALIEYVKSKNKYYQAEVKNDVIRFLIQ